MSFFKISYESDSIEGVKVLMQGMASTSNASPGLATLDQAPPPNAEAAGASDFQNGFEEGSGQETPPPSFDSETSPDMSLEMGPPSPDDSASFDAAGEDIEGTNPPAASDADSGFQSDGFADMDGPPAPADDDDLEEGTSAQPPKKSAKKSSKK